MKISKGLLYYIISLIVICVGFYIRLNNPSAGIMAIIAIPALVYVALYTPSLFIKKRDRMTNR